MQATLRQTFVDVSLYKFGARCYLSVIPVPVIPVPVIPVAVIPVAVIPVPVIL